MPGFFQKILKFQQGLWWKERQCGVVTCCRSGLWWGREGDHETAEGSKDQSFRERWSSPYVDVAENRWFSPGVRFVTEQNWMRPVGSRRFCPCGVSDKRAFHAVLRRAFRGACGTEEELFPQEYEEQFRLEGSMTRQDMAVMLFRCTERMGIRYHCPGNLAAYSDASEVSAYAQPAMSWAVGTGLYVVSALAVPPFSPLGRHHPGPGGYGAAALVHLGRSAGGAELLGVK